MPAASSLGPVDDAERAGLDVEPPPTRSADRAMANVLFSVSPSESPPRTLVPCARDGQGDHGTRAGHVESVDHEHGRSRSEKFRAVSSPWAFVVAATKRLGMAA